MPAKAKPGPGTLQVDEDRAWQEKFWTAQRIAWLVMAALVVAALAGLTGKGGPLASAEGKLGEATLEYPRITRWQSNEQLTLTLPASAEGEVKLLLSPPFAALFTIDSIQPEPAEVSATPSGNLFTFDTAGGSGERVIAFNLRSARPALAQPLRVALGDSPPKRLTVTVLP